MLSAPLSPSASHAIIPKTPMRRLLYKFDSHKPNMALGKRTRHLHHASTGVSEANNEAQAATLTANSSSDYLDTAGLAHSVTGTQETNTERARLAFQLHDRPLDAVVITTLPRYPFCCHEDLITMSRQQLVDVATLFNAQLPKTIQIDLSDGVSAAHIRHCIESLVGIIPNIPGAPKAAKSRQSGRVGPISDLFSEDSQLDIVPSPPTSPLAVRYTRKHEVSKMSSSSVLLESLEEEDENILFSKKRACKKRKLSDSLDIPTRYAYDTEGDDITPIRPLRLSPKEELSSSPDIHAQEGDSTGLLSPLLARLQKRSARDSSKSSESALHLKTRLRPRPGMSRYSRDTRAQQVHAIGMYEMETSFHSLGNDNDACMDLS
ncbi:hypothetical protein JR316_0011852 [Psilocybe cubensis]|uniref:Uncharacterized protein n=2 Tax=Psilocybe cubensis TaxID=181762 RepID=A0ACB8GLD4_PSICU|nr:hypothetical protein JR316_0011852 [Psilocybe cubensis]KAH9476279.1 hypothetical protein JR316_0011852 [Psilocybe cubensis]